MLIQKKFHLAMRREVAMARLLNLREYRSALIGLERSTLGQNGLFQLHFRLPWGFLARLYLAREWGGDEDQILFRSHGGNVELYGALHFAAIRPGLTEIMLVLEYTIAPPVHRWLDRYRHGVDTMIDDQIASLEAHFMRPIRGIRADQNLPTPMNGHNGHGGHGGHHGPDDAGDSSPGEE